MSYYIPDSDEGEESIQPRTVSRPRVVNRPRTVNRPTPVRARQASSSGSTNEAGGSNAPAMCLSDADDSSGSDETSFFRIARPSIGQANGSVGLDSDDASGDGSGEREKPSAHLELVDSSSSGSSSKSDSDSDGGDSDSDSRPQHKGSAEKRKLPDSAASAEHPRRQRSRSVSLTPPPEPVRVATAAAAAPRAKQGSIAPDIQVLDSDSDSCKDASAAMSSSRRLRAKEMLDLDPALQVIMQDSDAMARQTSARPTTSALPEKAVTTHVEFTFIYDDDFIAHDLPQIWDPKRWKKISPKQRPQIVKALDARMAVLVFVTDTMEKALQAFSDKFAVDVVATDPVLTINSMRVFPTSTIASLGIRPVYYVSVYPRSVFNRERERDGMERTRRAMEKEQAQRDLEMAQTLLGSTHATSDDMLLIDDDDSHAARDAQNDLNAPLGDAGKSMRIKVRDKSGKDALLLVTSATTIQAIIRNYISMAKLDPNTSVSLEFDDERLDPSTTIGDTEIEDDDMLTAIWR